MSAPRDFARPLTDVDARADALVDQALQTHRAELHARLAAWIRVHPDPQDPTTHLAPQDGEPCIGRIVPRAEAVAFMQSNPNPLLRELAETLSRMTPVPLGSIDVIVSTPSMLGLVRATPLPECMS